MVRITPTNMLQTDELQVLPHMRLLSSKSRWFTLMIKGNQNSVLAVTY